MTDSAQPESSADDDISLLDLLLVVAENARLLVFGPLLVGLAALGYAFTMTPIFSAAATILPPQQQQSTAAMLASQLGPLAGIVGIGGSGLKNPATLYVALARSRTVADRIIERFKLMQVYKAKWRRDARLRLEHATTINARKDGLIVIEVDDHDPKRAADMANAYVEELSRLTGGLAITEAQQRRAFFDKQLREAQENLAKAQLALGGVGVSESLLKSSPQAVLGSVARIKAMVTAQEIKLSTMRGYLTEQSPEFQLGQRELESLRSQLAQVERVQPNSGSKNAEYLDRYRDFKYYETLLELLAKQYESARLDEAREGALVQVVDKAVPPELRSRPRRARIAVLTSVATAVLLLIFVFVREAMRNARSNSASSNRLARISANLGALFRMRRG